MEENKIELEARCVLSNQNSLEESLKSQADEKQMTKSSNMVELQNKKRCYTPRVVGEIQGSSCLFLAPLPFFRPKPLTLLFLGLPISFPYFLGIF